LPSVDPTPEIKLAGILAPLSALRGRGDLGVGDTAALVEFASWAAAKGFGLVQILPVNETGSDHGPYNIVSSMAYEPSTITTTPTWLPELSQHDDPDMASRALAAGVRRDLRPP